MSSTSESLPYQIILLQMTGFITDTYCLGACAVLILYDHAITFPQEVELVWRRKITAPALIFCLNRLFGFVYAVCSLLYIHFYGCVSPVEIYMPIYNLHVTFIILMYITLAVFSAVRTYALGGTWPLATLVLVLGLVPVASNITDDLNNMLERVPAGYNRCGVTASITSYQISTIRM